MTKPSFLQIGATHSALRSSAHHLCLASFFYHAYATASNSFLTSKKLIHRITLNSRIPATYPSTTSSCSKSNNNSSRTPASSRNRCFLPTSLRLRSLIIRSSSNHRYLLTLGWVWTTKAVTELSILIIRPISLLSNRRRTLNNRYLH